MIDFTSKDRYAYEDLVTLIRLLRGPGGCPWDREQTHESILRNFQEETYEFCEAAQEDDRDHMCEELGDVLMQVVFHARIEEERGRMTMDDICDAVCKKLIFRHPHVFGAVQCRNSDEVLTTWDQVKRVEKDQKTVTDTLDAVARSLPALWRAEKMQRKAEKAGFRLRDSADTLEELEDAVRGLRRAVEAGEDRENALGSVLFLLCGLSGQLELDPERALHQACEAFLHQFALVEQTAGTKALTEFTKEELAALWERAGCACSANTTITKEIHHE